MEIDETRKILILPGKEPVPVMRRPVWSFISKVIMKESVNYNIFIFVYDSYI